MNSENLKRWVLSVPSFSTSPASSPAAGTSWRAAQIVVCLDGQRGAAQQRQPDRDASSLAPNIRTRVRQLSGAPHNHRILMRCLDHRRGYRVQAISGNVPVKRALESEKLLRATDLPLASKNRLNENLKLPHRLFHSVGQWIRGVDRSDRKELTAW